MKLFSLKTLALAAMVNLGAVAYAGLDEDFKAAAEYVRNTPAKADQSEDDKLIGYALYKQATTGDVTGEQPYLYQYEARKKWDAHAALKGKSQDDAKREYIKYVNDRKP